MELATQQELDAFLNGPSQYVRVLDTVQIGQIVAGVVSKVNLIDEDFASLFNKLDFAAIQGMEIHVSSLTKLDLSISTMPQLTVLNLSECKNLIELTLPNEMNQLTALDLSGCTNLNSLKLPQAMNQLTKLDLSECKNLIELTLPKEMNQLTALDLSGCTKFEFLNPATGNESVNCA